MGKQIPPITADELAFLAAVDHFDEYADDARDEPKFSTWEAQAADDAGVSLTGAL
jgi:hypothetical protein